MVAANSTDWYKRYILVVNENIDDRFHTSMLLQEFGYNVCTAHSASSAMEFVYVAPPDGIVTEAGLTGTSLLSRMKRESRFSDIPVILLSSSQNRGCEGHVRDGEYAAWLKMPVRGEDLHRVIKSAIEKSPGRKKIVTALRAKLQDRIEGIVTVLSEQGMFFRTLDPWPVDTRLPVRLEIKGKVVKLEAVIKYITSFNDGPFKEPGMGMKFVKIIPEDKALIKDFIIERFENIKAPTGTLSC